LGLGDEVGFTFSLDLIWPPSSTSLVPKLLKSIAMQAFKSNVVLETLDVVSSPKFQFLALHQSNFGNSMELGTLGEVTLRYAHL